MIVSLFKKSRHADKCERDLQLLHKLDQAQSRRARERSLALITSPKGLAALFTAGLAKGLSSPSITGQLKSMALILGKTNLDDWLTDED